MKKTNQVIFQFFDQNIMEKISKEKPKYLEFQENFKRTLKKPKVKQALTPFSLLEFAGIQSKDILKLHPRFN